MIIQNGKILKRTEFKNEKELQTFVEENMEQILGCEFIATEFAVDNYRLDSLAYNKESNSFVIVEYKNIRNTSLVDQGYAYLGLMLKRKEAFVLKYNNVTNSNLEPKDIDWSQSRIAFISPEFSQRQINATEFQGMPFDLIKVAKYEGNIIEFTKIQKDLNLNSNVTPKTKEANEVMKEIKVYTEADHFEKSSSKIKELYSDLKEEILNLGDIDIEPKKLYIAFKGNSNIADAEIYASKIRLFINMKKGTLKDPMGYAQDISNAGHHGNGDYVIDIKETEDIPKAIEFVRQSYEVNKK